MKGRFLLIALLVLLGSVFGLENDHLVGPLPYQDPSNTLGPSYAGYFEVNIPSAPQVNRALFYWYFPAQNGDPKAPIIIWFQGGPGSSSMLGLFYLNGPLRLVENDTKVTPAEVSWNKEFGVIFIDNPVGTGYSYVEGLASDDETGFVRDQQQVAEDMYNFLLQFYEKFPELLSNDLYITGESYAGKYCPAVADYIRLKNLEEGFQIPLKGVAVGNGLTDPKSQVNSLAEHVYNLGLVDENQKKMLQQLQFQCEEALDQENWLGALDFRNQIYDLIKKWTGGINFYDVRRYDSDDFSGKDAFLNREDIKKSLNIGNHSFTDDDRVYNALKEDVMKSTANLFPTLIDTYKVLIYTGQWDIRDGIPGTLAWLYEINWDGIDEYYKAARYVWRVDNTVAGFAKSARNLTEVTIVNSSHMVPFETPKPALDMITRWIKDQSFETPATEETEKSSKRVLDY